VSRPQADAAFMDKSSVKENRGHIGFILFVEPATGLMFANPAKSKTTLTYQTAVENAMESGVFRQFNVFQSDREASLVSEKFIKHLKRVHGVSTQTLVTGSKGWSVERGIRTIKTNLGILMTRRGNENWIDLLPKVIRDHNNQNAFGTRYRRKDITERVFLDYLDERYRSKDHTMSYAGSRRDYHDMKVLGWEKVFRFRPKDKVLLSVDGDYQNKKKLFWKKSTKGYFSKTIYIVREASLRASGKGHLVPG